MNWRAARSSAGGAARRSSHARRREWDLAMRLQPAPNARTPGANAASCQPGIAANGVCWYLASCCQFDIPQFLKDQFRGGAIQMAESIGKVVATGTTDRDVFVSHAQTPDVGAGIHHILPASEQVITFCRDLRPPRLHQRCNARRIVCRNSGGQKHSPSVVVRLECAITLTADPVTFRGSNTLTPHRNPSPLPCFQVLKQVANRNDRQLPRVWEFVDGNRVD